MFTAETRNIVSRYIRAFNVMPIDAKVYKIFLRTYQITTAFLGLAHSGTPAGQIENSLAKAPHTLALI
jgi:hypothetical protein